MLPVSSLADRRVHPPPTPAQTIAAAPHSPNRDSLAPHRPVPRLSTDAMVLGEARATLARLSEQKVTSPGGAPGTDSLPIAFQQKLGQRTTWRSLPSPRIQCRPPHRDA